MTDHVQSTDSQSAAEQDERAEMFGFHPEILSEAAGLPRRVDGRDYEYPTTTTTTTTS